MYDPFDQAEHATPLTPEEREGLIPSHVTMRTELNELEQQNIFEADVWAVPQKGRCWRAVWAQSSSTDVSQCVDLGGKVSNIGQESRRRMATNFASPVRGHGADTLLDGE